MTKIKHVWSVLCRNSVIDRDDNNISLQSIMEQLTVNLSAKGQVKDSDNIGIPLNYEIVSMWQKKDVSQVAKGEVEYTLLDPKGKGLIKNTRTIEIPKTLRRFRSRMKISGLPLTLSGDYTFQIRLKEEDSDKFKLVSELPLEIKIKFDMNTSNSS